MFLPVSITYDFPRFAKKYIVANLGNVKNISVSCSPSRNTKVEVYIFPWFNLIYGTVGPIERGDIITLTLPSEYKIKYALASTTDTNKTGLGVIPKNNELILYTNSYHDTITFNLIC